MKNDGFPVYDGYFLSLNSVLRAFSKCGVSVKSEKIKSKIVDVITLRGWLDLSDMLDIVALAFCDKKPTEVEATRLFFALLVEAERKVIKSDKFFDLVLKVRDVYRSEIYAVGNFVPLGDVSRHFAADML